MCSDPTGGILDFCSMYAFFRDHANFGGGLPEGAAWLAFALAGFTLAFIVINGFVALTGVYTWFERRALGRFQSRLGPNRWGPFGLLQPMADVIKLMTKEDTTPESADRPLFAIAPVLFLVPGLVVVAFLPFGDDSFLGELNVGVLFIIGITGANTFGIFIAGWASRNKYAMLGAMRGVAMLISYEVPLALALIGVVILAGSMSLNEIVIAQGIPFVLVQPLGFLVFMAAASAEMSRAPFDVIEAESELGGGYNTEFSGMKFAIFQLAEFMAPIVNSAVATVLFLGGAASIGPIPAQVAFALKVFGMVFLLLWVRATWPRLRVDQIMGFAWKGLLPLALVNVFLVAVEIWALQDPDTGAVTEGQLWLMTTINWGVMLVSIVVIANVLGQRRVARVTPVPSPLANMAAEAD